ncbi:hypothetical protein N1851_006485 [Merluccius polli]|uniref:DUF5641 domain-containing protein n=1 Tax=Merluccius polli TaxID=89951 RepID=A0AA47P8G6_MERPO|nr:hypothetical protein N1851_006485 [Merluccius polli]
MFLAEKQCEFVFNAPSASHAGGVWERQIRTIRNVLNATLTQSLGRLDDASLRTLFYEAMAIVNSLPLTVDGINDPTALEPLTPNHLIQMKSGVDGRGIIVKEDLLPRNQWQLERIVERTVDNDGLVRRVKLQVGASNASGNLNSQTKM